MIFNRDGVVWSKYGVGGGVSLDNEICFVRVLVDVMSFAFFSLGRSIL